MYQKMKKQKLTIVLCLVGIFFLFPSLLPAQKIRPTRDEVIITASDIIRLNEGFTSPEKSANLWWEQRNVKGARDGALLVTGIDTHAPDLLIDPKLTGWYSIYVGIYTSDNLTTGLFLRTTKEPYFTFIKGIESETFPNFSEILYKELDMTGQSLIIHQPLEYRSYLDYIKFVPLTEGEKVKVQRIKNTPSQKDVIGIADFWHWFYFYGGYEAENPAICVQEHADYGLNILVYGLGQSCMNYNTQVGTSSPYDSQNPRSRIVKYQCTRNNPLKTAVETAHTAGLKIYAGLGMNSHAGTSGRTTVSSDFAVNNSDLWERHKDGSPYPEKLCFGFKEVRKERIDLLMEALSYGVDGFLLNALLNAPLVEYGRPLVNGYQSLYKVDPTAIDPANIEEYHRWLKFRAEFITMFIRELMMTLKQNKKDQLPIALLISDDGFEKNLEAGIDLPILVQEKLISAIITLGDSVKPYLDLVKGTDIKVYGGYDVQGDKPAVTEQNPEGSWPLPSYIGPNNRVLGMQISELYSQGVHGVALYHSDEGINYPELRPLFQTLKDPKLLEEYLKQPPK